MSNDQGEKEKESTSKGFDYHTAYHDLAMMVAQRSLRAENERLYLELQKFKDKDVEDYLYYCPNCGSIQHNSLPTRRCCPDSAPVKVPKEVAEQARQGFKAMYR